MATDLYSFPVPLLEALAAHETLRKLGFAPEQIFIHRNPAPMLDIIVVVKHRGKQCVLTLGVLPDDDWRKRWNDLALAFNSREIPSDVFDDWYEKSFTRTHLVEILLVLESKGIKPPLKAN